MRLLILASEFPPGPGGIGTHAYEVARHLQRLGWEVVVVARQDYSTGEEIAQFNRRQQFPIFRLRTPPTLVLEFVYRLLVVLRHCLRLKPDLVLATGRHSVWVAACLHVIYRRPLVAVIHGTEALVGRPPERALTRWAFSSADQVVAVSEYTKKVALDSGIRPRGLRVIPNGADEESFTASERVPYENDYETLRLLTVGNVTERKGQEVMIRALPYLTPAYPNLRYDMIGLPTRRDELAQIARELKVDQHIRFLGKVDRQTLVEHMHECDVFVMTSRQTSTGDFEGYGIAVVEAALCAKPAIVSNSAGLVETVIDGKTGYVVPENDPKATAEKLRLLLNDEALRRSMGRAARARALAEQTWTQRVSEYHQVLLKLARQR